MEDRRSNCSIKHINNDVKNNCMTNILMMNNKNLWFLVIEFVVLVLLCFRVNCNEFKNCFSLIYMLVIWLYISKCLFGVLLFVVFVVMMFVWLYLLLFDIRFDDLMLCFILLISCFITLVSVESIVMLVLVEFMCLILLCMFSNELLIKFGDYVFQIYVLMLFVVLFLCCSFCLCDSELCLVELVVVWVRLYLVLFGLLVVFCYSFLSLVVKLFVITDCCDLIIYCLLLLLVLYFLCCSVSILSGLCFAVSMFWFLVSYLLFVLMAVWCYVFYNIQCMLGCVWVVCFMLCNKLFSLAVLLFIVSILIILLSVLSYYLRLVYSFVVVLCCFQLLFVVCNLISYLLLKYVYCISLH